MAMPVTAERKALPLSAPVRVTTIVVRDKWQPGWLEKMLTTTSIRPLRFIWPDRSPAGIVFAVTATNRQQAPEPRQPPKKISRKTRKVT